MIKYIEFKNHNDNRGSLVAIESFHDINFNIKRVYYLFKNDPKSVRAKHAHKKLQQVYIAVSGSCKMRINDGKKEKIINLNQPNVGVFFTEIVWRELYDFSPDCVLMVLADEFYDETDYIRTYEEFLNYKKIS
ncbi:MAG: FdtA/QdtA family cupin domain-containing protein [Pseudomonadota bacterium]